MSDAVLSLLGGIGLFLFGMLAMTNGLRALAGQQLRRVLRAFTVSPLTGAATGAAVTAALQSSSATIMAVIGFVGAGLMTFPQALGVILGANIGTTVTGWMVAVLGLKLQLSSLAMPVLFVASLTAMLGRGGWRDIGMALSGFALVFMGLGLMQGATVAVEPLLAGNLPDADGVTGRLALVGLGFVFTAITQASSAGIAAVIVMLAGGAVDLVTAAALVIGMDVGTTVKAVLTTLGGSAEMRRTALAHVGYNVLTGAIGFLVVTKTPALLHLTGGDETTALTLFHTLLNVSGVILILPFAHTVAAFIERAVPSRGRVLPDTLDRRLLGEPMTAIDAARVASVQIAAARFGALAAMLRGIGVAHEEGQVRAAIEDLEDFLSSIALPAEPVGPRRRLTALLHLTDHLNRIDQRGMQVDRVQALLDAPQLSRPTRALAALLERAADKRDAPELPRRAAGLRLLIRARAQRLRLRVLSDQSGASTDLHDVFRITDALRWAERVAAHAERIIHYADVSARDAPTEAEVRETDLQP